MYTGMAFVAIVGVAAMYHKRNSQILQETNPHPLEGSIAKRMERFDNLAGQASPEARFDYENQNHTITNQNNDTTTDGNVYVKMEMEMSSSESFGSNGHSISGSSSIASSNARQNSGTGGDHTMVSV